MKTIILLIFDQFVNDVEWEVIPTIVQTQQNVFTAEVHLSRSSDCDCEVRKKEKEIMKSQNQRRRKNLGLMMIVKHLFRNENKLSDNLKLVLCSKIWKNFRVKARRTIRESKRKSWKQYVSRLNSRTSVKKVWDMVRKIQGKGKSASINHLKKNNDNTTSKKDIANTSADSFSKNSSSENYISKY